MSTEFILAFALGAIYAFALDFVLDKITREKTGGGDAS